MTHFNIDLTTEQLDRLNVEIDRRMNLTIVRHEDGLSIYVYPRTEGQLWDAPFTTFEVRESEIRSLEEAMTDD